MTNNEVRSPTGEVGSSDDDKSMEERKGEQQPDSGRPLNLTGTGGLVSQPARVVPKSWSIGSITGGDPRL